MFASVATNARVRAALEHHERLAEEAAARPARSPAAARAARAAAASARLWRAAAKAALAAWRRAQEPEADPEPKEESEGGERTDRSRLEWV